MLDLTSSVKTKELRFLMPLFLGVTSGREHIQRARPTRHGRLPCPRMRYKFLLRCSPGLGRTRNVPIEWCLHRSYETCVHNVHSAAAQRAAPCRAWERPVSLRVEKHCSKACPGSARMSPAKHTLRDDHRSRPRVLLEAGTAWFSSASRQG
jgi:hypothetical protein